MLKDNEEARMRAYEMACGLMNVAEIEFGNDFQYTEGDRNWTVQNATQKAICFVIKSAKETDIPFKVIEGQLIIG